MFDQIEFKETIVDVYLRSSAIIVYNWIPYSSADPLHPN
jgi:hypothetical protein